MTTAISSRRVLIVGGGIGGLAVARGLVGLGAQVVIVERAPEFSTAGAGIMLAANAVAVLDALGIDVTQHGHPLPGVSIADHRGRILQQARADELHADYRNLLALHRADLHTLLLNAAAGAQLRMDRAVTRLDDDGDVVTATFSDDSTEAFELVIGADGLNSSVRALVYGSAAPGTVYSGYTCWRFVAPCHEPLDGAVEMFGRGDRAGVVPLAGKRAYVFLVADAPANAPAASWAELQQRFNGFPPLVARLIDSARTADAPLLHHDLRDAERVVWGRGRVWLLGDAAHAPLPNLGQGAAMALEDALALAEALRSEASVTAAFDRYVRVRHERASVIWRDSRRLGRVAQAGGALTSRLRNALFRLMPPGVARRQIEAIVGPGVAFAAGVQVGKRAEQPPVDVSGLSR